MSLEPLTEVQSAIGGVAVLPQRPRTIAVFAEEGNARLLVNVLRTRSPLSHPARTGLEVWRAPHICSPAQGGFVKD